MTRDRLPMEMSRLPCRVQVAAGTGAFELEMHYNAVLDRFAVHLFKNGQLVCAGEKLQYGEALWADVYRPGDYPPLRFVPLDESGEADVVNRATFGKTVFLTVDDTGGDAGGAGGA